jgi:hypothetical protein
MLQQSPSPDKAARTRINPLLPTITIQCHRPDLHTHYTRFVVKKHGVALIQGNFTPTGQFQFSIDHAEFLPFQSYPEAKLLHDGYAWNLIELQAWARHVQSSDIPLPYTATETTNASIPPQSAVV